MIKHYLREWKEWINQMSMNVPRLATLNPFEFLHSGLNLVTETVRALPYTITHVGVVIAVYHYWPSITRGVLNLVHIIKGVV